MSIGLAIIDMQKEFFGDPRCRSSMEYALEYINAAASIIRESGNSVFMVQDTEAGNGPGTEGFALVEGLGTETDDVSIHKIHSDAFWESELESALRERKVDFLVISGFAAEHCVLFTYNGAQERGFGTSILQNGVAGYDIRTIELLQLQRSVISLHALEYLVRREKGA